MGHCHGQQAEAGDEGSRPVVREEALRSMARFRFPYLFLCLSDDKEDVIAQCTGNESASAHNCEGGLWSEGGVRSRSDAGTGLKQIG